MGPVGLAYVRSWLLIMAQLVFEIPGFLAVCRANGIPLQATRR